MSETDDETHHRRSRDRGRTVHGEAANAGHRVLAPDDAEVEAYLETALHAPPPERRDDGSRREPDTVVVLDFGSQFAQLIARRVRELNVYCELLPHDTPWAEIERRSPKAIILSGGPVIGLRRRRAAAPIPRSGPGRHPGAGHLLRHAADGARARRRGGAVAQARVRPGRDHRHGRGRPLRAASTASSRSG